MTCNMHVMAFVWAAEIAQCWYTLCKYLPVYNVTDRKLAYHSPCLCISA